MTDFVLVHGAFRGPWAWDRVRPRLEAAGHRVLTPELTDPTATLDSYIAEIVRAFDDNGIDQAVLVGHSQGGFVAKAASEHLADRTSRLIYLDAPVPSHGDNAFDFRPPGVPVPDVDRGDLIEPRPVEPGAGLSSEDADWINARLVPQPVTPSMNPVTLVSATAARIPESFVFFEQTPPLFPCAITRKRLDNQGAEYTLIDAPHDAIVTHANAVADLLLSDL